MPARAARAAVGWQTARAETPLETNVLAAVRAAHFEGVVDFGAGNEDRPVKAHLNVPAQKIAHPPNVNVAVIQLDGDGKLVDRAFVLLSRDYPDGVVVPLDKNLGAPGVRFRCWDIERSDGGTFSKEDGRQLSTKGWTDNPPLTDADDLLPGREGAALQFMTPYPASLFKLMVAFHILRMVDAGKLGLATEYTYSIEGAAPETLTISDWIDPMMTVSDNHATAALLKLLHDRAEIDTMNGAFAELNLGTLQINGTNPKTGRDWSPGKIHMTAIDVARLLWLIDGGSGTLWQRPDGKPVTADYLSDSSRTYLKKILSEQAWNRSLSTANMPGAPNVSAGIPAGVASRWINPTNGHVIVGSTDFGVDVREANRNAEVDFAHKGGLSFNYASDAGIVTSLPGKPFRHYIIAFSANLGSRYADKVFADRKTFPVDDPIGPIAETQRIPVLGKAIDDAVTKLSAAVKQAVSRQTGKSRCKTGLLLERWKSPRRCCSMSNRVGSSRRGRTFIDLDLANPPSRRRHL